MESRRLLARVGAAVLLVAAVALVAVVPGVGTWIGAAVLAGLASALGGLVTRSADKAIARGRAAVLDLPQTAPLIVEAWLEYYELGHIGPMPEEREERQNSPGWVPVGAVASVHLMVEATVDRAVILTKLDVRVESRSAAPLHIEYPTRDEDEPRPAVMPSEESRTFQVNLSDPTPVPKPARRVPKFPYTVSHLDPERFRLRVIAGTPGDVTWRVDVHWRCNGQSGIVIADEEGQPFRLVTPR